MAEANPKVLAKRLWSIVRIVFFMIRKGISKSKLMVHLHNLMTKRGKISAKVIGNLMFHHYNTFTFNYRSSSQNPHLSFVIPREYEFSCSNSPAYPFHLGNKRKTHRHSSSKHPTDDNDEDPTVINAVQKIMEMLNNEVTGPDGSPVLPGFGCSPMMVRQLRITDSPFPLRDADEDSHVDKDAEEFIERFYAQLRLQNNMASILEEAQ